MIRVKCNICNDIGHESSYCTETWRQFHSTVSINRLYNKIVIGRTV